MPSTADPRQSVFHPTTSNLYYKSNILHNTSHQPRTKESIAMHITAINLVRKGNYACVEICTEAGWTEVISESIDAPFSHTVHEAGMKARIDGTVGMPHTLPVPLDVTYSAAEDNFYNKTQYGMGSEFYQVWKERREEFPKTPPKKWKP